MGKRVVPVATLSERKGVLACEVWDPGEFQILRSSGHWAAVEDKGHDDIAEGGDHDGKSINNKQKTYWYVYMIFTNNVLRVFVSITPTCPSQMEVIVSIILILHKKNQRSEILGNSSNLYNLVQECSSVIRCLPSMRKAWGLSLSLTKSINHSHKFIWSGDKISLYMTSNSCVCTVIAKPRFLAKEKFYDKTPCMYNHSKMF